MKHLSDDSSYHERTLYHESMKEGNVLFNDALDTFYLRLYGVGHMVKYHSESERNACMHTYINTLIYIHTHTYNVHIHRHTHTYIQTYTYTDIHTYIIHKYMNAHIHTQRHTHTYIHAHTYIHIYIHTYTRTFTL